MKRTLLIPILFGFVISAACDSSSNPVASDSRFEGGAGSGGGQGSTDEFQAAVESVDPAAGTFTLATGVVLKVTDATTIDPLGDLLSLQAVEAALNAGANVRAEGDQVLEDGVLRTTNVKFEVDNQALPELDDEFNGTVEAVDLGAGTFTLTNGLVIKVTGGTTINPLGDLLSLQAVETALNAGANVSAEGDQVLEDGMLRATNVKFEVDEQADLSEARFEALIASFDPKAKTVDLVDGTQVEIVAATRIKQEGDLDHLNSFALMAEAVTAGFPVEAKGQGALASGDSPTIVAERIEFEFEDGPDDEIRTIVDAVQLEEKSFKVASGLVVKIVDGTRIKQSGDNDQLGSLNEALDALAAGERVEVRARGFVTGASSTTMVAQEVEFERG